jgi:acyl-CoA reductase-like NAD-dependent aldehyde dehydrogenase
MSQASAPIRHADRLFIGGQWVDRARQVAGQLRSGTVGHNAFRTDFGVAFGGFKQSGIGREGGREGLLPFLEVKTVILEGRPEGYEDTAL